MGVWDQRQHRLQYQEEFDRAEEKARHTAECASEARNRRRARRHGWSFDPRSGQSMFQGESMTLGGNAQRSWLGGLEGDLEEEEKSEENISGMHGEDRVKWYKIARQERWSFDPWTGSRLAGKPTPTQRRAPEPWDPLGPPSHLLTDVGPPSSLLQSQPNSAVVRSPADSLHFTNVMESPSASKAHAGGRPQHKAGWGSAYKLYLADCEKQANANKDEDRRDHRDMLRVSKGAAASDVSLLTLSADASGQRESAQHNAAPAPPP